MEDKTFLRITNREIYDGIQDIRKVLAEFKQMNEAAHAKLEAHAKETNGKVKLNRWIATTALSLFTMLAGVLLTMATRG